MKLPFILLPHETLSLESPKDIQLELGQKAKQLRLYHQLKRETVSKISGVSVSTIKNFEDVGKVNLQNFVAIAFALGVKSKLQDIFTLPDIQSIQQIEEMKVRRKRGCQ